jgi:hypothetical protein
MSTSMSSSPTTPRDPRSDVVELVCRTVQSARSRDLKSATLNVPLPAIVQSPQDVHLIAAIERLRGQGIAAVAVPLQPAERGFITTVLDDLCSALAVADGFAPDCVIQKVALQVSFSS